MQKRKEEALRRGNKGLKEGEMISNVEARMEQKPENTTIQKI